MSTENPRSADGAKLCAWCGGDIKQSGIGRSRDYCRRSCRQRAYEQREVEKTLQANKRLMEREIQRIRAEAASVSSRDGNSISSRDEIRHSSRDEMKPAGQPMVPAPTVPSPLPRAGRRRVGMQTSAMPLPFEADAGQPDAQPPAEPQG